MRRVWDLGLCGELGHRTELAVAVVKCSLMKEVVSAVTAQDCLSREFRKRH